MRLVQFRPKNDPSGTPRPGILISSGKAVLDLRATLDGPRGSGWLPAHNSCEWWNVEGSVWPLVRSACEVALVADDKTVAQWQKAGRVFPLEETRLAAPIPRPGKVICVGLNYRDHAIETGLEVPRSPIIFAKWANAVVGPEDTVLIPRGCEHPDYEAELAVIIGRTAKHVAKDKAFDHVLGYTCFNDVSARDYQLADKQWVRGKTCDTFAPLGPAVVTKEEVSSPEDLAIKLRLNGQTMQDSRTSQLIFGIAEVISFLSNSMTLEPGDVIATGTPPGVGFARKPPIYIKPGDRMEVDIEGVGVLVNTVGAA